MSKVSLRVFEPWLRLRFIFTRLEGLLERTTQGAICLQPGYEDHRTIVLTKQFFERLALLTTGLSRPGEGDSAVIKLNQIPNGSEYDDARDFLSDFAKDGERGRFYDQKVSFAIVACLGRALITGIMTPEVAGQLLPTVKEISDFAVSQTSGSFDQVEIGSSGGALE